MRTIEMEVNLFGSPRTEVLSEAALRHLLEALTLADQVYLRGHPECPHPYEAGIRYEEEEFGKEDWQAIPYLLDRKKGDCEDLAAYLCAWRRERDHVAARCHFTHRDVRNAQTGGMVSLYHIVVIYPNGRIEDPSRKLGMK
jgi:hypothetical protein